MMDKRLVFTEQKDSFCEEYNITSATSYVLVGWLEHTKTDGWKLVTNAWLSVDDIVEILDFMRGLERVAEVQE